MKPAVGRTFFYDIVTVGNYKYFSSASANGLYRMDRFGRMELMNHFPDDHYLAGDLHSNVYEYGGELFFIPLCGNSIPVYHIEDNCFEKIETDFGERHMRMYQQGIRIEDDVLLIPFNLQYPFAILQLKEKQIKPINSINNKLYELLKPRENEQLFQVYSAAFWDGVVYIAVQDTNKIIEMGWEKKDIKIHTLRADVHLKSVNELDGALFFTCRDQKIIRWIPHDEEKEYDIPNKDQNMTYPYLRVVKLGESYFLIPGHENCAWNTNKDFSEWKRIELPKQFRRLEDKLLFVAYEEINDEKIMLYPRSGNGALCYDASDKAFVFINMTEDDRQQQWMEREWIKEIFSEPIIYEDKVTLTDYISALSESGAI